MSWTHSPMKRDDERPLSRWGCHLDAAAYAGVDPSTVRRWRRADPDIAGRCDVSSLDHVHRINDTMLMRLLRRLPLEPGSNR